MIPRQVTTRAEFFPGFGMRELVAAAVGGAIGYVLYNVTSTLFGASGAVASFFSYVVPLLCPVVAVAAVLNGEHSLLAFQLRAMRFQRRPRKLFYRVGSAFDSPGSTGTDLMPKPLLLLLHAVNRLLSPNAPRSKPQTSGIPQSVQQWLPVHDLHGGMVVRRDGTLVAAIRVEPRNIALLSDSERRRLLRGVQAAINPVTQHMQLISIPRPIDLDGYLRRLDAKLAELPPARQRLLRQYIRHVGDLVAGGEAQERRCYLLLAQPPGKDAAEELRQLAFDLAARLRQADLIAEMVDERELLNLLYVFHHPRQAAFERPALAPHPTMLVHEVR